MSHYNDSDIWSVCVRCFITDELINLDTKHSQLFRNDELISIVVRIILSKSCIKYLIMFNYCSVVTVNTYPSFNI